MHVVSLEIVIISCIHNFMLIYAKILKSLDHLENLYVDT